MTYLHGKEYISSIARAVTERIRKMLFDLVGKICISVTLDKVNITKRWVMYFFFSCIIHERVPPTSIIFFYSCPIVCPTDFVFIHLCMVNQKRMKLVLMLFIQEPFAEDILTRTNVDPRDQNTAKVTVSPPKIIIQKYRCKRTLLLISTLHVGRWLQMNASPDIHQSV